MSRATDIRVQELQGQVAALTARVWALEQAAAAAPARKGRPAQKEQLEPQTPLQPVVPPKPVYARARSPERDEVDLVGTWFARAGVIAVLLGAGFGFKYAIDRGLIGPLGRVLIGVALGFGFLVWSEYSRRRVWPRLAQALGGGGVALLTLSVWAAFELYDLIPTGVAFGSLVVITVGTVALALHHRSEALAVLVVVGGLIDPLLVGIHESNPGGMYAYLLLLAAGAAALTIARSWRIVALVAFAGTWALFGAGVDRSDTTLAFTYATLLWGLFLGAHVLWRISRDGRIELEEVWFQVVNAFVYLGVGLALLEPELAQGSFATGFGLAYLAGAWVVRAEPPAAVGSVAVGVTALAVAVPVSLDGEIVPVLWALQGVVVIVIARSEERPKMTVGGLALLALATLGMLTMLEDGYEPARALASGESASLVALWVAGFVAAAAVARGPGNWRRDTALGLAIAANVGVLGWLSLEATAAIDRRVDIVDREQATSFTLSALWAVYAIGMMAFGVAVRNRSARLMATALFGVVIAKMVLSDLWELETAYRFIGFSAIGAILLAVSLMYHRFRTLILGDEPTPSPDGSEGTGK